MTPLTYKVLRKRDINSFLYKKNCEKIFYTIYPQKMKTESLLIAMQKKSEHEKTTLEVDTLTGEYYTVIPEWVIHDMDWFEGQTLEFNIDSDEVIIKEADE